MQKEWKKSGEREVGRNGRRKEERKGMTEGEIKYRRKDKEQRTMNEAELEGTEKALKDKKKKQDRKKEVGGKRSLK